MRRIKALPTEQWVTLIEGRLDGMQIRLDGFTDRMGDLNGYVGDLLALKTSSSSSSIGRNAWKRCFVGHRASCDAFFFLMLLVPDVPHPTCKAQSKSV
jgi:hypothetical protein